jgi:phosphoglycerate dehydrogenase-like enzyme
MPVVCLPSTELRDAVGEVSGVRFVVWDGIGEPDRADEVEVFVAPYLTSATVVDRVGAFPHCRLVQLQTAGHDGILPLIPPGVTLANAAGVHDDATAELALGLTIASLRGIDDAVRQHGHWQPMPGRRALADSRVLILGYGSIGRAVAERMLASKARVTGVASRPRADDLLGEVRGPGDLDGLLPHQDVVVVVLPLNDATRGQVGDDFLGQLADGALVVNVARGSILDTDAVLRHTNRLRFALDVTDPEPLPDDHPLWQAPGVLITPHIAGGTTAMLPRIAALVRDQVSRYAAGRPLRNVIT